MCPLNSQSQTFAERLIKKFFYNIHAQFNWISDISIITRDSRPKQLVYMCICTCVYVLNTYTQYAYAYTHIHTCTHTYTSSQIRLSEG